METEVEEQPKLSDGGVVCKFYEEQGVAEGAYKTRHPCCC